MRVKCTAAAAATVADNRGRRVECSENCTLYNFIMQLLPPCDRRCLGGPGECARSWCIAKRSHQFVFEKPKNRRSMVDDDDDDPDRAVLDGVSGRPRQEVRDLFLTYSELLPMGLRASF